MPTYDCKQDGCDGKVTFPEKKNPSSDRDLEIKMVIIVKEPSQCPKCGKSWYERELKT